MLVLVSFFGPIFAFIAFATRSWRMLAVLVVLVGGFWAYALVPPSPMTGEEFVKDCQSYIYGDRDSSSTSCELEILAAFLSNSFKRNSDPNCTHDFLWRNDETFAANSARILPLVIDWLSKNPEFLDQTAKEGLRAALFEISPCAELS